MRKLLVTGGAGFIGSNFILQWVQPTDAPQPRSIVNLDALTYAGNPANLACLMGSPSYTFVEGDICDEKLVASLLRAHQPDAVIHFAAESHVDRSIVSPQQFITTNVQGTFVLLDALRTYLAEKSATERGRFRYLHVSTDEVFGSLRPEDRAFHEETPYTPRSPYAASKAASDHLVRAYVHTYDFPAIITNCSNNYGPYQFPEKMIPVMFVNALAESPLPIYGDGLNIRDWLYVVDHCNAICAVLERGRIGESYNIGGRNERTNIEVVDMLCDLLDELRPRANGQSYRELKAFVGDRPGHDRRYAIDASKVEREIGWRPAETFATGLRKTVQWYLDNPQWIADVQGGQYREWMKKNYEVRGK